MKWIAAIVMTAVFMGVNGFAQEAPKVDKTGERVYRSKCKSCHGGKGEGINRKLAIKKKLDPDALPLSPMADKSDEEVMKIIAEGEGKMAGFGQKLKPEQLQAVLEYCRILVPATKAAE